MVETIEGAVDLATTICRLGGAGDFIQATNALAAERGLVEAVASHDTPALYAWRGGRRLTGMPGSPEFIAAYIKAHQDRRTPPPGIVFALVAEFRGSAEFTSLARSTRKDYSRYLRLVEEEFGGMPLAALSDPRARGDFMAWRDTMADTPRKADFAYTVLARVLSFAKNRGRIAMNPCERGGRLYAADRVDAIWTEEMIGRAVGGLPQELRWAFVLALWTGQRQGDLLRLPWSAFDGQQIRFHQSKTGRRLVTGERTAEG